MKLLVQEYRQHITVRWLHLGGRIFSRRISLRLKTQNNVRVGLYGIYLRLRERERESGVVVYTKGVRKMHLISLARIALQQDRKTKS